MSTISGVMGIVTGFADANLYLTAMPEVYRSPYPTAVAPQMERLGYRSAFWYAGPDSWENQGVRARAGIRGVSRNGRVSGGGNVWGVDDAYLYEAVLGGADPATPGFDLILNASDHSPYTVDLRKAGFDRAALKRALPEARRNDRELIDAPGHFWYADRMLSRFIQKARQKFTDSLFIIAGDHADRTNVDLSPSLYERYCVPLVISGAGVSKGSVAREAAGSHIDLPPTLIELVAPRRFCCYSVGTGLTRANEIGVNYGSWITRGRIGKTDALCAAESFGAGGDPPGARHLQERIDAVRAVSWLRAKRGGAL